MVKSNEWVDIRIAGKDEPFEREIESRASQDLVSDTACALRRVARPNIVKEPDFRLLAQIQERDPSAARLVTTMVLLGGDRSPYNLPVMSGDDTEQALLVSLVNAIASRGKIDGVPIVYPTEVEGSSYLSVEGITNRVKEWWDYLRSSRQEEAIREIGFLHGAINYDGNKTIVEPVHLLSWALLNREGIKIE